jgi:hypothetical protein
MRRACAATLVLLSLTACVSTGRVGVVTRSGASPARLVTGAHPYEEVGPASARACRYFILAVVPFGDSTLSTAINDALENTGGDALLNATVSSSLFGFIPYYNVLAFACSSISGTAIRFTVDSPSPGIQP